MGGTKAKSGEVAALMELGLQIRLQQWRQRQQQQQRVEERVEERAPRRIQRARELRPGCGTGLAATVAAPRICG